LPRRLPHDQSVESELFDGADHGGLRGRRLSDRALVHGNAAPSPVVDVLLGLLPGVSVDFRLPTLFLSSGYFLFFLFHSCLPGKCQTLFTARRSLSLF
jgi:hypothetical protein